MDLSHVAADTEARSQFIGKHREYIRRTASLHCGRPLNWGRDEELSVAMIAFNSALDAYNANRGAKFETFAALVIKRRLIDYRRRSGRSREYPVAEVPDWQLPAKDDNFLRLERAWELEEFEQLVAGYDITFRQLSQESPRQDQVRERLLAAVTMIADNPELHRSILTNGRLPLEQLSEITGETKKALAKRRRYLLAVLAVAARKDEFPFICTYLGIRG